MYIENIKLKNNICFWLAFNYFLLSIMIIVGGLTRLTDSGLSITQWELFSGILPPFNEIEWNELYKLSEETFVEESDDLKEKAAGAGLTDND